MFKLYGKNTPRQKKNESKITLVSAKHVWTNDKYIFSSISIQTLTLKFNRVFFFLSFFGRHVLGV